MKIKISTILALFLGVVFVFSGITKLLDVKSFVLMVSGYPMFSSVSPLAMVIPPLEILLGIGLIMLMYTRQLAKITAAILVFFTVIYLYGYYSVGISDCGCFGALGFLDSSPQIVFIRNLILIASALFVAKTGTLAYYNKHMKAKKYSLYTGAAIVFALAFISSKNPLVQPAPTFQQIDVDISAIIDFANMDKDKTYLIFVYSMTCPSCWSSVDAIKEFQDSDMVDEVIGITIGRRTDLEDFTNHFNLNFRSYLVNRSLMQQLAERVPTTFFVQNNIVVDELGYPVPGPVQYKERIALKN